MTREHQASSVPFPFTGVADFEASIRMPVGETFVPRTSFKKLTRPKVKVAKGAIIDPVDKSELVKRGIVRFNDMTRSMSTVGCFEKNSSAYILFIEHFRKCFYRQ